MAETTQEAEAPRWRLAAGLSLAAAACLALAAFGFSPEASLSELRGSASSARSSNFSFSERRLSWGNPFQGRYYVNPSYRRSLGSSIAAASAAGDGKAKHKLSQMMDVPSAYWLDKKSKIQGGSTQKMEGILADAAGKGQLVVFIIYNLPNRDCHAKSSNGEICCSYLPDGRCNYLDAGDGCRAGIQEYKTQYINPIAAVLRQFKGRVPVALVVEPDALSNLATNTGDRRCGNEATRNAYTQGAEYAIKTLAAADPGAAIYLDAAHGGWLGWPNNMASFVQLVRQLGVSQLLRGFASNVAGYQLLGSACPSYDFCLQRQNRQHRCCWDPCGVLDQSNPSNHEMNYALQLRDAMSKGIPGFYPKMVIDTGRNGNVGVRSSCSNWCNIRDAGAGHVPTSSTGSEVVDAYFWLKTPGESDGCSATLPDGRSCPRFDQDCASPDSIGSRHWEPAAPEAGEWFDYQARQLAENARFH